MIGPYRTAFTSSAAGAFASLFRMSYSAVAVGFTLPAGFIHEKAEAPPIGFADRNGGPAFFDSR